jgi:hypothetical protein
MIGNREINRQHAHDRADQSLALTQRQPKNRSQSQSCLNSQIGIHDLAARRRSRLRLPARQRFLREPDRQASTIAKRCVIVSPVRHPMPLTGNVMPALGMKLERHHRFPAIVTANICPTLLKMTPRRYPCNKVAARLLHLAHPLLTYVRLNKGAIINYGARYRSGRRISTALAESAVNSLVARRMVKKQQMQWSKRGAHLLLQVRAAVLNGDLRERLAYKPPRQAHRSRFAWMLEPTPPLLVTA